MQFVTYLVLAMLLGFLIRLVYSLVVGGRSATKLEPVVVGLAFVVVSLVRHGFGLEPLLIGVGSALGVLICMRFAES